mgnify:CR=1 FL=1
MESLEKKEDALHRKEQETKTLKERTEALYDQQMAELERISGMTFEEAKGILLSNVEQEIRHETAVLVKDLEQQAKEELKRTPEKLLHPQFNVVLRIMLQSLPYR